MKRIRSVFSRVVWQSTMFVRNFSVSRAVTGDADVVVSLTTHGRRIETVHFAIESIARGNLKPRRLILWLDSEEDFRRANDSRALRRLKKRGLEILRSEPMGPHSKYFPYVESEYPHSIPLVTADDDVFYPKAWLEGLVRSYGARPSVIHCYRAHRMTFDGGQLRPYMEWPAVSTTEPKFSSFLTGVSGVIYPPFFLDVLKTAGDQFRDVAPKADDVWIHAQAVKAGVRVAQVGRSSIVLPVALGTQRTALWRHNTVGDPGSSANDAQVRFSYSAEMLARIAVD